MARLIRIQRGNHGADIAVLDDGRRYLTRSNFPGYTREAIKRWVDRHWGDDPAPGPWIEFTDAQPPTTNGE